MILTYVYLNYNKDVIEGRPGFDTYIVTLESQNSTGRSIQNVASEQNYNISIQNKMMAVGHYSWPNIQLHLIGSLPVLMNIIMVTMMKIVNSIISICQWVIPIKQIEFPLGMVDNAPVYCA